MDNSNEIVYVVLNDYGNIIQMDYIDDGITNYTMTMKYNEYLTKFNKQIYYTN
jgi:hypothetical protein